MKLLVQPEDGLAPILAAINSATKSIQMLIFRFDHRGLENALRAAVARGVAVHALIANREGGKTLQKLELSLLEGGVTVGRTGTDWVRYHSKMLIVDRRLLFVLAFNFTHLDIERSRSFAIATRNRKFVAEAIKLFEADSMRQAYLPAIPTLVVSPENSRPALSSFLREARRQLFIYDTKLTDSRMLALLRDRVKAGVEVRVIGKLGKRGAGIPVQKFPGKRLHCRVIIRDSRQVFVGSQSLRRLELDRRREVGLIVREPEVVRRISSIFEADWAQTEAGKKLKEAEQVA